MIDHPLTLPNGTIVKHRLVKSAMSEALSDARNDVTDALIALYERWSKGGGALLITGNVQVDRWHLEHAGNLVLDALSDLARAGRLAAAAKSGGALALVQLSHAGRQTPETINDQPLSISSRRLELPGYGRPRAADDGDLQGVVGQFARSAQLAQEAGFDGVEIHAAHGYLLSSSLSPRINTRSDPWGGSLENRARLALSVVDAVRAAVGSAFVVAVKLNSSDFQKGGFSHDDSIAVARLLEGAGIDFLEISGGNFEAPVAYRHASVPASTLAREAYFLDYAKDIKAALRVPVMVTGGFRSRAAMDDALSSGAVDLIGMGRPFIADPSFPGKLLRGEIEAAPAVERTFPPADELPPSAALNWFSHQLGLQGREGRNDLDLPIVQGHERHLEHGLSATGRLLDARRCGARA